MTKIRAGRSTRLYVLGAIVGVLASGAMVAPAAAEFTSGLEAYRKGEVDLALDLWRRYAVAGDVQSMKALGDYYAGKTIENSDGEKVGPEKTNKPNYVQALKWYTLAGHHDFAATFGTPDVYQRNAQIEALRALPDVRAEMTDADVVKAERLVSDALEGGSPRDIYAVADMYRRGAGLKKDNNRAYELFLVASRRGDRAATLELDVMREKALVDSKQIKAAEARAAVWQPPLPEEHTGQTAQMAELKRLQEELQAQKLQSALEAVSDIDVAVLQHSLRSLGFYFGGVDNKMGPQTREAIRRFQYSQVEDATDMTAAEKQNVKIGVLSATDTVSLISQAARRAGNDIAQYTYGVMHLRGIGVAKDGAQAVYWLTKAADQNVAEAHYALGVIYRDGSTSLNAVTPDKAKAAYHFATSAALGYGPAQRAVQLLKFEDPASVE